MHNAGYYMGDQIYPPNISNPKGFFENVEINDINELILSKYDKYNNWIYNKLQIPINNFEKLCPRLSKKIIKSTVYHPRYMQRWLISIPVGVTINNESNNIKNRIKEALNRIPFCYKDPRFSYTLPVWRKYFDNETVFLCIFREPNITVKSILKECKTANYLRNVQINEALAYEVWFNMYSHILEKHYNNHNIIFIHYNQVYDGLILQKISDKLNTELSHDFVDKALKRTRSTSVMPKKIKAMYGKLCELSHYERQVG